MKTQAASSGGLLHAVKLRKLLALCESHGMVEEAHELVTSVTHASAPRYETIVPMEDGPPRPRRLTLSAQYGRLAKVIRTCLRTMSILGYPSPALKGPLNAPIIIENTMVTFAVGPYENLVHTCHKALEECVDQSAATSATGAVPEEGRATAELRAFLRSEGLGAAAYYSGPAWLPPYFALLLVLSQPPELAKEDEDDPRRSNAQQARDHLIALSMARTCSVNENCLPDAIMLTLLQFFAGVQGTMRRIDQCCWVVRITSRVKARSILQAPS